MLRPALRPAIRVGEILEPVLDSSNDLSSFPTADGDGATSSSVDREREREREDGGGRRRFESQWKRPSIDLCRGRRRR